MILWLYLFIYFNLQIKTNVTQKCNRKMAAGKTYKWLAEFRIHQPLWEENFNLTYLLT